MSDLDKLLKHIVETRAKAYLEEELKYLESISDIQALRRQLNGAFNHFHQKITDLSQQLEEKIEKVDDLNLILKDKIIYRRYLKIVKEFRERKKKISDLKNSKKINKLTES